MCENNSPVSEWLEKNFKDELVWGFQTVEYDEEFKEGFIIIENEDQVSREDAFEFVKKVNYRIQKAIKENDTIIDLDREFFIAAVKQTEAFLSNEKMGKALRGEQLPYGEYSFTHDFGGDFSLYIEPKKEEKNEKY